MTVHEQFKLVDKIRRANLIQRLMITSKGWPYWVQDAYSDLSSCDIACLLSPMSAMIGVILIDEPTQQSPWIPVIDVKSKRLANEAQYFKYVMFADNS